MDELILSGVILVGAVVIVPMFDTTDCVLEKDGSVLYSGPAYNVNCKSAGDATKCTIGRGGLLHFIPSRHIIGKNIDVSCK